LWLQSGTGHTNSGVESVALRGAEHDAVCFEFRLEDVVFEKMKT
jgi:hypothetical protein